jgi:hypothetical protein
MLARLGCGWTPWRRHVSLLLAAGALLQAAPSPGHAATGVGEAVIVVSLVRGTLGAETREIVVRDNVFTQEVIETGPDAATRLVFLDGTELSIGPESQVTLDRYVYDPSNKGAGEVVMNLVSGVFEFASGDIPSSGYDLRTPFATIAVRGTRLNLVIGDDLLMRVKEGGADVDTGTEVFLVEQLNCFLTAEQQSGQGQVILPQDCEQYLGPILAMDQIFAGVIQPAAGPLGGLLGPPQSAGAESDNDPTLPPPPISEQ